MGLGLTHNVKLTIECATCGGRGKDHEPCCPSEAKEKALDAAMRWVCVKCRTGMVEVTSEDLLQCRSCATRYSRGELCDVAEPEFALLHQVSPVEDYERVKVFAKRGVKRRTVFKIDVLVKRLRQEEILWRCRRRDEKEGKRRGSR